MRSRRRNAPNVPTSLHRSASASNRRFSLPEKLRRLAIATTSGSRRAASGETISPVALRAPSATVSPEEPDNPSKEDFNNEVMCMSYLYSKLPETGVSPHIDTGGIHGQNIRLYGIDAPESSQFCVRLTGECWLCGQQASFASAARLLAANPVIETATAVASPSALMEMRT